MERLAPQSGTGFLLEAGQVLRVVDPEGGQVSDLFCFAAADHDEWLSSGRTIDYAGSIYPSSGDILYSNRSQPMLTITVRLLWVRMRETWRRPSSRSRSGRWSGRLLTAPDLRRRRTRPPSAGPRGRTRRCPRG